MTPINLNPNDVKFTQIHPTMRPESIARAEAIKASLASPGSYVSVYACFGLFLKVSPKLHVHEPSDSAFDWYVLNGTVKPFTAKQHGADQRATPVLS